MTRNHLLTALLLTGCAFLISLVYNPLGIPSLIENPQQAEERYVVLAGREIRVAVADTPERRAQGLSGRAGLSEDEGMLFIFPEDGKPSFWMKDMRFSIDILWVSSDGIIVDMQRGVSPETYPTSFTPSVEARYVLELPAGWAEAHAVKLGDKVGL